MTPPSYDPRLVDALSASRLYQDFARAFTSGTGLPLSLHAPGLVQTVDGERKRQKPFCALMAKTNETCAVCEGLQQRLEEEAQFTPKTLKCSTGLCLTAVPVRADDKLVAFLQTGHILLHRPNRAEFDRIARTLRSFGGQVDLERLEEAYFSTRVFTSRQYEALVRLLTIFAEHLGECSKTLALQSHPEEPPAIVHARTIIAKNAHEELSLDVVAQAVGMSASYFGEKFKEVTGINFTAYVARTRIEKARILLHNAHLRISEIAFGVGFQSLSQFNRAFKQVTGKSPSEYRQSLTG